MHIYNDGSAKEPAQRLDSGADLPLITSPVAPFDRRDPDLESDLGEAA